MSDRKALALEIAARTKPRFIQIKPEGRAYKATRFRNSTSAPGGLPYSEEELTARRGGMTAEEYRCYLIRATGLSRGTL